jgi:hypothetical protein
MYPTMRGLLATLVLLLGALAVTGLLASGPQKATAGHRVDEDFLPGGEALTDRFGWRLEPRAVRSDAGHTESGQADTGANDTGTDKARSRPDPDDSDDGL